MKRERKEREKEKLPSTDHTNFFVLLKKGFDCPLICQLDAK